MSKKNCNPECFLLSCAAAAEVLSTGLKDDEINLLATFLSTISANMFAILACKGGEGTEG